MEIVEAGNGNTVRVWASDLDPAALEQAKRTARSPVVSGPVSLMADAHVGMGATIGSVVPTKDAIIPSCVGVDLGCGISAVKLNRTVDHLPDDRGEVLAGIGSAVPAGLGKWHGAASREAERWMRSNPCPNHAGVPSDKLDRAWTQLGTLGGGNHFVEVSDDEDGNLWIVLHSGSRGIGNLLATQHIRTAKQFCKDMERSVEDRDLAYFLAGDPHYDGYVADMEWAQMWAFQNRDMMLDAVLETVAGHLGGDDMVKAVDVVRCHHNYATKESHGDGTMWVTRKGAIRAARGDRGIIPGSMGTATYIVEGAGSKDSYTSASHGAGRRMSRSEAKANISETDLAEQMEGRTWLTGSAAALVDESPLAYKDIETVMADQADLVSVTSRLDALINYKGTA